MAVSKSKVQCLASNPVTGLFDGIALAGRCRSLRASGDITIVSRVRSPLSSSKHGHASIVAKFRPDAGLKMTHRTKKSCLTSREALTSSRGRHTCLGECVEAAIRILFYSDASFDGMKSRLLRLRTAGSIGIWPTRPISSVADTDEDRGMAHSMESMRTSRCGADPEDFRQRPFKIESETARGWPSMV